MTWVTQGTLLGVLVGYLIFLFLVASAAEALAPRLTRGRRGTVIYVLAASVYCTAWTFYGSVGLAANRGLEFLTIYLGPALVALLWPVLLRKLVRVSKEQRITSVSDFIASRYGKSAPLGSLVALLLVGGMIPYIALQLKAVSASFKMILGEKTVLDVFDPSILVAATLALFGILFGARNLDFTKQQTGLMTAVAVESVVKLLAFLLVGVYVTWGLFGGFTDLFGQVAEHPEWARLLVLDQAPSASYARWTAMLLVSMAAVMFLPRQFHVLVVQNPREDDVRAVSWSFPLYLFLINLFVLPIACAGLLVFPEARAHADGFILRLPLHFDSYAMSVVVFLGGFSAATAMIVVDSLALSKMITNDVILPILLRRFKEDIYWATLVYTRVAMLGVVGLGLLWARLEGGQFLLVEMGLLSFIAVTQCAPAILLGLYWRGANRAGAYAGISAGFAMWFYTLIIPALVKEGFIHPAVLEAGPLGLGFLRPTAFLGLDGLDTISHGVFWSLFVNVAGFVLVSLFTEQDAHERVQAAAFVGSAGDDKHAAGAPAILSATEIQRLIHHYVGPDEARAIVGELFGGRAPADFSVPELLELRIRFERLLAASLGAAAARIIIEDQFTISKEEAQELVSSFQRMQQSLRLTEEEVHRGERLLASVVQSVDDCIFTANVEGCLVTMNPAGQRLLGYAERDVAGRSYRDLLAPDDRDRLTPVMARTAASGDGWSGQVTGRTASGLTFPAHLAVRRIFDDHGHIMGTVGVLRDLTEQVETQRRLIQREKLASLGEMAAGVAHEIRNPLGGIKMATRLLSSRDLDGSPLSLEMARAILAGIAEIEGIINNLLDFTREARLERGEYEVLRILDPVVESSVAEGLARGVKVAYGQLDREAVVQGDGQRLRQVFANLLKNALEAIPAHMPRGRVEVNLAAKGDRVVVEVADNGVGISGEHRDRIFQPFFTTKPSGTGLGMAIVKKIVDLHGGDIAIDSAPGRGTRVRVALPAPMRVEVEGGSR